MLFTYQAVTVHITYFSMLVIFRFAKSAGIIDLARLVVQTEVDASTTWIPFTHVHALCDVSSNLACYHVTFKVVSINGIPLAANGLAGCHCDNQIEDTNEESHPRRADLGFGVWGEGVRGP